MEDRMLQQLDTLNNSREGSLTLYDERGDIMQGRLRRLNQWETDGLVRCSRWRVVLDADGEDTGLEVADFVPEVDSSNFGESESCGAFSLDRSFGGSSIITEGEAQVEPQVEENFGESSISPVGQEITHRFEKNFGESSISPAKQAKRTDTFHKNATNEHATFGRNMKESRVNKLRSLKTKGSPVPNFKAKLWALRIQDELTNNSPLRLPSTERVTRNIQGEEMVITGTDVEALFPSLRDVESARIVREAVLKSETVIENLDCNLALKYLYIVGGVSHLKECGLARLAPRWTGKRPDLLTVGGETGFNEDKWVYPKKTFSKLEEKMIAARVLELAVLVCMGTHAYSSVATFTCKGKVVPSE